jgi:hypothetical protein
VSSMPKHSSWVEDTVADISSKYDCTAIARDVPRMVVLVAQEPTPATSSILEISRADAAQCDVTDGPRRSDKARRLVQALCELCEETEQYAAALDAAWAEADAEQNADVTAVMNAALIKSGILSSARPAVPLQDEPMSEPLSEGSHEPALPATPLRLRLQPASRTAKLLVCFTQGVVFYAVQRLRYLLSFSWVQLQDVAWIARAFASEPASGGSPIVVLHHQLTKNFVAESERSKVPSFEVEYTIEIHLSAADAAPTDVTLNLRHCRVVAEKCPSALKTARLQGLRARLLEVFEMEPEEVSVLVSSQARR